MKVDKYNTYTASSIYLHDLRDSNRRLNISDVRDGKLLTELIKGIDYDEFIILLKAHSRYNPDIRHPNNIKVSIKRQELTWKEFLKILHVADALPIEMKFCFEFEDGYRVEDKIIVEDFNLN
jgi:hypothetical protein